MGSLYRITYKRISLDTVMSQNASTFSSVCKHIVSEMTLGGVGLSRALEITLTKRPFSIFDHTLYTILSNKGDFITVMQWLEHPSHMYDLLAGSVTTIPHSRSIKKSLTDHQNLDS